MSYGPNTYGSLAFSSSALTITIGPITAVTMLCPSFDMESFGAGDTMNVSVQRLQQDGTTYEEIDNFTLSTPVVIAAAPGQGYIPQPQLDYYDNPYGGLKFVCTYTLGTGNSAYPSVYYDVTAGF